jgi:hypothetical protein
MQKIDKRNVDFSDIEQKLTEQDENIENAVEDLEKSIDNNKGLIPTIGKTAFNALVNSSTLKPNSLYYVTSNNAFWGYAFTTSTNTYIKFDGVPALIDALDSESTVAGLTANQGKILKGLVDTVSSNLTSLANNRDFEGTYWFGRTKSTFTPPAPTNLAHNYFDFTTNTVYRAYEIGETPETPDGGIAWNEGEKITTLSPGKSMVYISDQYWDLGQDAGQRGFAYLNSDNTWGYAPDRFHSGDGETIGFNGKQEYTLLKDYVEKEIYHDESTITIYPEDKYFAIMLYNNQVPVEGTKCYQVEDVLSTHEDDAAREFYVDENVFRNGSGVTTKSVKLKITPDDAILEKYNEGFDVKTVSLFNNDVKFSDYVKTKSNASGFPNDRSLSVLTWTKAVREEGSIVTPAKFTISPKNGNSYFETSYHGVVYKRKEASINIDWIGFRYIIFPDNETNGLIAVERPDNLDHQIVAYCYYNPFSEEEFIINADERHQWDRDPIWHQWQHTTGGLGLVNEPSLTININTADYTNSINISSPINITDEGLLFNITNGDNEYNPETPDILYQPMSPLKAPVLYVSSDKYYQLPASSDPYKQFYNIGGYLYVNNQPSSSQPFSQLAKGQYMCYWVISTNSQSNPIKFVMGRKAHTDINTALEEEFADYDLPMPEIKLLFQLVVGYNSLGNISIIYTKDLIKKYISESYSWLHQLATKDIFKFGFDEAYPETVHASASLSGNHPTWTTQALYYLSSIEPDFLWFKWTATDDSVIEGVMQKEKYISTGNKVWNYHWENYDPVTKSKFTAIHIYKVQSGSIMLDPLYNGSWWSGVKELKIRPYFITGIADEFTSYNEHRLLGWNDLTNSIYSFNLGSLITLGLENYINNEKSQKPIEKVIDVTSSQDKYIDLFGVRFELIKSSSTYGLYVSKVGEIAENITEVGTYTLRHNLYSLYDSSSMMQSSTSSYEGITLSSTPERLGSTLRIGYSYGSNCAGVITVKATYASVSYVFTVDVSITCAEMSSSSNAKLISIRLTPYSKPYIVGE